MKHCVVSVRRRAPGAVESGGVGNHSRGRWKLIAAEDMRPDGTAWPLAAGVRIRRERSSFRTAPAICRSCRRMCRRFPAGQQIDRRADEGGAAQPASPTQGRARSTKPRER